MNENARRAAAALLNNSLKDIGFTYAGLTDTEKVLVTEADFNELTKWLKEEWSPFGGWPHFAKPTPEGG